MMLLILALSTAFWLGWICCILCSVSRRADRSRCETPISGYQVTETLRRAGK